MPVYASTADMLGRFDQAELTQLTDEAGTGSIDQGKIAAAIASASSTMDGFIAAAYQLPLTVVPVMIIDLACDLARFRLWKSTPPEGVAKAHSQAMTMLRDISRGHVKLDQGVEQQVARDGAILVEGASPVFSRQSMGGY